MRKAVLFVMLAFLAGCMTYREGVERKGRAYVERYPAHVSAVNRAVSENRVIPGMTRSEVLVSRGNPEEKEQVLLGRLYYERWRFCRFNGEKCIDIDTVYFRNGIVMFVRD